MGACFSSNGGGAGGASGGAGGGRKGASKTPQSPFSVTIAFPTCIPFSLTVAPDEKIASIRKRATAEMERRSAAGEDFCKIEGTLVTVDGTTGENVHLRDGMTITEAQLEPKQYLWFQDKNEDIRVQNLLLRSSRLTENTSHNSRGVKQGMAMIKEEEGEADNAY